jgi:multiple sugar transport system permease protein
MDAAESENNKRKYKPQNKFLKFLRRNYVGWLFNLPLMIGLAVFTFVPMFLSLYYSLFEIEADFSAQFIGFGNYLRIFTDRSMPKVALNTVLYAVISVPLNIILSYFLALLVNQKFKFTGFFRIIYYLPVVIPAVVNGLLWKDLTDSTYGVFNKFLLMLGFNKFPFFSSSETAMISLIFMNSWGIGGGMVLWLSAFKNIPNSLYESAKIEGANAFQRFLNITLPLSTPMIFYNMIMSVIGTLQYNGTLTFASRYGRGEGDSLFLYGVKVYWEAFRNGNIGYASALSWLLFIVIAVLTGIMFASSKCVYYQENA